jgi:hypothetical protein
MPGAGDGSRPVARVDNGGATASAIERAPSTWPAYDQGARRFLLRRFVYRIDPTRVVVVAIAHAHRCQRTRQRKDYPDVAPAASTFVNPGTSLHSSTSTRVSLNRRGGASPPLFFLRTSLQPRDSLGVARTHCSRQERTLPTGTDARSHRFVSRLAQDSARGRRPTCVLRTRRRRNGWQEVLSIGV